MNDVNTEREQFILKRLLVAQRQFTPQDSPHAVAMRELLPLIAPWITHSPAKATFGKAYTLAQKCNSDKSINDPLAEFCFGFLLHRANSDLLGWKAVWHSANQLKEQKYPPDIIGLASMVAGSYYAKNNTTDTANTFFRQAVDFYLVALADGVYAKQPSQFLDRILGVITQGLPLTEAERLVAGVADQPDQLPAWAVELMKGFLSSRAGWEARGSGFANTVTDEGWRQFKAKQIEARDHYIRAYELNPNDCMSASRLIGVAMSGFARPGEDERFWFDRARARQIDCVNAYQTYLWSLRPRWGGSADDIYAFAVECTDPATINSDVPYMFFEGLVDISEEQKDYNPIGYWDAPGVAVLAHRTIDAMIDQPYHARRVDWLRSLDVAVDWANGEWKRARETLTILGDRFDPNAIWYCKMGVAPWNVIDDVYLFSSTHARDLEQAEEFYFDNKFDQAIAAYERIRGASADAPQPFREALDQRIAKTKLERQLSAGEWFEVKFDDQLNGFRSIAGSWRVDKDGSLVGEPGFSHDLKRSLLLVSDAVGVNAWEMTATVDATKARGKDQVGASIITHYEPRNQNWRSISFLPLRKTVTSSRQFHIGHSFPATLARDKSNRVHVMIWGDNLKIEANDILVYEGPYQERSDIEFGSQFGFGAIPWPIEKGHIAFRDIRMRGLKRPPAASTDPPF